MPWTPTLTERENKAALRGSLQPKLAKAQMRLDKLPGGAVILDGAGQAWQSGGIGRFTGDHGYWYRAYGDDDAIGSFELTQIINGEFTVIHPTKEADRA